MIVIINPDHNADGPKPDCASCGHARRQVHYQSNIPWRRVDSDVSAPVFGFICEISNDQLGSGIAFGRLEYIRLAGFS